MRSCSPYEILHEAVKEWNSAEAVWMALECVKLLLSWQARRQKIQLWISVQITRETGNNCTVSDSSTFWGNTQCLFQVCGCCYKSCTWEENGQCVCADHRNWPWNDDCVKQFYQADRNFENKISADLTAYKRLSTVTNRVIQRNLHQNSNLSGNHTGSQGNIICWWNQVSCRDAYAPLDDALWRIKWLNVRHCARKPSNSFTRLQCKQLCWRKQWTNVLSGGEMLRATTVTVL